MAVRVFRFLQAYGVLSDSLINASIAWTETINTSENSVAACAAGVSKAMSKADIATNQDLKEEVRQLKTELAAVKQANKKEAQLIAAELAEVKLMLVQLMANQKSEAR
jgi:hypothetical protein